MKVMLDLRVGPVLVCEARIRESGLSAGLPTMYAVDGLPSGQSAAIGLFGHRWRVLRISSHNTATWSGDFDSPQAAVEALSRDLHGAASPPPTPEPHDHIARQNEDGDWTLHQVDRDGSTAFIEGPCAEAEAMRRLRTLRSAKGSAWMIDAWGVQRKVR